MSTPETLGVIGWNVCDRAVPTAQFHHLERQEKRLRENGARAVLLCLSEVTAPLAESEDSDNQTLLKILESQGYAVNISMVTVFKKLEIFEGIAFASCDPQLVDNINDATFIPTILQKAHFHKLEHLRRKGRFHDRKIGTVALNDLKIHTTHASYHSPPLTERQAIMRQIGQAMGKQILIGDLNTGLNKRLVREANQQGWIDLPSSNRRTTWPLRIGRVPLGAFKLDHVLVTPELFDKCSLEVAEKGPSDHHPLLVLVEG